MYNIQWNRTNGIFFFENIRYHNMLDIMAFVEEITGFIWRKNGDKLD